MKAIAIARVSTEEQKDAGNSIPAQFVRMENYCKHKVFSLSETGKISFDESAYKKDRKNFDKFLDALVEESKKQKIAVCFDKVDRLSRNIFDKRISKLYEMAVADIIELHFVSDGQIINNQMSAVQKFQFGMSLGLAKYYSDAISDNTKRGLETKRRNGEWTAGKVPLGYKWSRDENDNPIVVIDHEKAHLIRKAFELYSTGLHSVADIIEILHKEGLRSFTKGKVALTTMFNSLSNPFYYGQPRSQKYGLYPSFHEYGNIICKELFDKCQEVKRKKNHNIFKSVAKAFVFQGLLTCQNCGCAYTPELHIKKSGLRLVYYSCTNGKKICKRQYINENTLLKPILADLRKLSKLDDKVMERLVKELRKASEQEIAYQKSQIKRITTEIDRLRIKKDNLIEMFIDPSNFNRMSITKDEYDKKLQNISDLQQTKSIELEEHLRADTDYKTAIATVFSVAKRAEEIFLSSEVEEKRQLLNFLLQNPVVNGKNLYYTMKSPFNVLLNIDTVTDWGDYRVSIPN